MQHCSYLGCPLEQFFLTVGQNTFGNKIPCWVILNTYNIFFQSCKHSIEFSKFWITLCTQHRTEKCNPSFFYYVYAALWRFDMHDILLDCQLLLLWFLVSSTATTNYYFAWNYTLWKISKRQLFFPYLSLSLFIDDYTKFVQQMTPGRFMTRKNAIKTFYVQLRALSTIPK